MHFIPNSVAVVQHDARGFIKNQPNVVQFIDQQKHNCVTKSFVVFARCFFAVFAGQKNSIN